MNASKKRLLLATLLLPLGLCAPRSARAFTEDVCYVKGGGVTDCTPLPAECQTHPLSLGKDKPACREAAIATYAATLQYAAARSTVHVDVPFILAQAVGFSSTSAYWMAAYSEATDLGTFEPRDETGATVGGGALATASITGLERNDFATGGMLIHFSAPRNPSAPAPVAGIDGLHPDPNDATHEILIANLRAWAMTGAGQAHPQCAGGFTAPSASGDDATGTACYALGGKPATINGAITIFDGPVAGQADADTQTFAVPTGLQIIQDSDAGLATSDTFDQVVGGAPSHVADARLGIYLHAFGDRTSHHVCLDHGFTFGPTDGGADWQEDFTNSDCAQGLHTLRHIWETGVDVSQLDAEDRTTLAYLGNAYDELVAFAAARGTLAPGATDATARAALVGELSAALQTPGAAARLAALHTITCGHGLAAFPGEASCPASDAGAGAVDGGPGNAGAGDAGAADAKDGGGGVGDGGPGGADVNAANADVGSSAGCSTTGDAPGAAGGVLMVLGLAGTWWSRRRRPAP